MSVINKKPFVISVLETLDEEQITTLKNLIDGSGSATFYSLVPTSTHLLTAADKGVKFIDLEVSGIAPAQRTYQGYLIYNNSYCVLIAFATIGTQSLKLINMKIDSTNNNWQYEVKTCELSITELRSALNDLASGGGSGSDVVINPEGAATDTATKIQVDDTIYALPKEADIITKEVDTSDNSFTVSSDDFVKAANSNNCILVLVIGSYFYTLNKEALDNNGITFTNNMYKAYFNRDGATYTGVVEEIEETSVVVNPTLTGTEPQIAGLEVNGAKYRVPELFATDGIKFTYSSQTDYDFGSGSYSSYVRIVGSAMIFVASFNITKHSGVGTASSPITVGQFTNIPSDIFAKLVGGVYLDEANTRAFVDGTFTSVLAATALEKGSDNNVILKLETANLAEETEYHIRHTSIFLLTDNLSRIDSVFANNSWTDIQKVFAAGEAADYWALGDTKDDLGTDGNTRTFRIIDLAGVHGKHGSLECVQLIGSTLVWNPSSNTDDESCYNNYSISQMVSTHLPAIKGYLSNELQAALETSGQTTVKVAKNGNNGTLLDVSGYLYLPAEKELFTSRSFSRTEEFNALTTFGYYLTHSTNADRIKYDTTNTARFYWERSPRSGYTGTVCDVDSYGGASYGYADGSNRVAPCFDF